MFWILAALLAVFGLVGLVAFCYTFVRRGIPDPATEEGRRAGAWEDYAPQITEGVKWIAGMTVKPMQVMSYDGKRLYGRFIARENAKGTVIFFHGYRSHYSVDFSASMRFYHELGYNTLYCDQRAHGLSQGRLITFGIREHYDVLSWVTYLAMMLGEDHPVFLSGLSMGAATVLMAADMEFPANVRGIIADCGFTSCGDQLRWLLKTRYRLPPGFGAAVLNVYTRWLGGFDVDQWSTEEALAHSRYPVLLVHGLEDRLVPAEMSRRAYEACTSPKQLELFPDAGHGVSWLADTERYQNALMNFLEQYL